MNTNGETASSILVYIGSEPDNAIGEDIIKIIFARALRDTYPDAHITWIPGYGHDGYFDNLLRPITSRYVNEFITDLFIGAKLPGRQALQHPILERAFDIIIDTQTSLSRTFFLRRIPHRLFISRNLGYFLSDRKPPPDTASQPRHIVEKLLCLLAAASGKTMPAVHTLEVEKYWKELAQELLPNEHGYIGFAPGAGDRGKNKCWPLDSYIEAASIQADHGRVPVFLLGPQEHCWWPVISKRVKGALFPEGSVSLQGRDIHGPSLLMALAGRLDVAVANCSGTGHMLAAGGAAMISLFGPTRPEKYAPYALRLKTLRAQDYDSNDIASIPVNAVCQAIEDMLAK